MATADYRDAATVVLYAAKDHEVATDLIMADALRAQRHVLFPKVIVEQRELSLIRVDSPAQLASGAYGLLEPSGAETVPVADLGRALICVPGLAFSPSGQRLGRGGGYYDRLLAAAGPRPQSVGLAYAFQVLDRLPQSLGDQRLDLIVSESAVYRATAPAAPDGSSLADQGGTPRC